MLVLFCHVLRSALAGPPCLPPLHRVDRLSAAFHIREWWPIVMADRLGYFAAFVVVSGILGLAYWAFMILYSTVILLCLGFLVIVPAAVYAMLVGAALFGEAYRGGTDTLRMRSEAAPGTTSA
jgi:hypothetical protein